MAVNRDDWIDETFILTGVIAVNYEQNMDVLWVNITSPEHEGDRDEIRVLNRNDLSPPLIFEIAYDVSGVPCWH